MNDGPMNNSKRFRSPQRRPKKGLSTDLESEVAQEIETLLGPQALAELDFEAVEMAARREAFVWPPGPWNNGSTPTRADYVDPELPCPCGCVAHYHGRYEKTFESVLGPLHLKRATTTVTDATMDLAKTGIAAGAIFC